MKKKLSAEFHTHAPELNKLYINSVVVPNYIPKVHSNIVTVIREYRERTKRRTQGFATAYITHTGGTSELADERTVYVATKRGRENILEYLRERSRGVGTFLQDDGSFKELSYDYKITKATPIVI